MTKREIAIWAATRLWRHLPIVDESKPLELRGIAYAECFGADDPVCGLARFSVHGCAGAPARVEFLEAIT